MQHLGVHLDVRHTVHRHLLISFALFDGFFYFTLGYAFHLSSNLSLCVEWINKEAILQAKQIVAKQRFQNLALSMIELTFAMHHAHFPLTCVRVSKHFLTRAGCANLLRPAELAVTVELSEMEVASILAATDVNEVAVAMS